MTDVFISVLNLSAGASIVAIAVLIMRVLLIKAPKIFSYALWTVVFLRFICFVHLESPASLMPTNAEIIPHTIVYEPVPYIDSGVVNVDIPLNQVIKNNLPESNPTESVNPVQIVLSIAAYLWIIGIGIMISYAVVGYIRLKQRVYDAVLEEGNVYRTDKISTAFVLGFVRPKIYIPLVISGVQRWHIFQHEKVHIKRCDYLIKPLAFIILAVHWFNPMAWISYYFMSKDMEMSCDEAVLRNSESDMRQEYSMSLVKLYTHKTTLLNPLAFGEGSYHNMKARIKNVLNFRKPPKWAIVICSLLFMVFVVGFTTTQPQKPFDVENTNVAMERVERPAVIVSGQKLENFDDSAMFRTDSSMVEPLIVNSSYVDFDDGINKWSMPASYVTNTSDKNIIYFEQAFMAYDKFGNPLELYWDEQGVDQNGGVKNVGLNIMIKGIFPISPKAYANVETQNDNMYMSYMETLKMMQDMPVNPEGQKEMDALIDSVLEPGEIYSDLWSGRLVTSVGTHKATYIISVIKSVTFEDETVWNNPNYDEWVSTYEGNYIPTSSLKNYYQTMEVVLVDISDTLQETTLREIEMGAD